MVRVLLGCVSLALACTDDPMLDLCDGDGTTMAGGDGTTMAGGDGTTMAGGDGTTMAGRDETTAAANPGTGDDATTTPAMDVEAEDGARHTFGSPWLSFSLVMAGFGGRGFILPALLGQAAAVDVTAESTCSQLKEVYKSNECCGNPEKVVSDTQIVPVSTKYRTSSKVVGANVCAGAHAKVARTNQKCFAESVVNSVEASFADIAEGGEYPMGPQSGGDVTKGFKGGFNMSSFFSNSQVSGTGESYGIVPNKFPYRDGASKEHGGLGPLCPVNVHWHLGAEHRSEGQYDENGKSPNLYTESYNSAPMGNYTASAPRRLARRLAGDPVRYGFACHHYDASDTKFTTEYDWKHCTDMKVGETYEVHWPHSVLGACGTPFQYQTKFYDGIFCRYEDAGNPALSAQELASNVGVQAQVFTIVNDEEYYYPDLINGMIVTPNLTGESSPQPFGQDLAIYAGSSTGTSRDNTWCSMYTPITWQVDRTCHLISASSFDKMCADMKLKHDPMDNDLHPHGARELVVKALNSDELIDYNHGGADEQTVPR